MTEYLQEIFFHYILSRYDLSIKIKSEFFDSKVLQVLFNFCKDYVLKYREAPTAEELKQLIEMSSYSSEISDDQIDILYAQKGSLSQYGDDWLSDNVIAWAQWQSFCIGLKNTVKYVKIKQTEVDESNVKEICEHAKNMFNHDSIIDFNTKEGSDFYDALSHQNSYVEHYTTGYKYLDNCLDGGYWVGSLHVFLGAPKIGKSLVLQNLVAKSVSAGDNSAYISLELSEGMINQRIASNLFSVQMADYKIMVKDVEAVKGKIQEYRNSGLGEKGALHIKQFPTSTLSVVDLEAYLLNKEDELSTVDKPFKFKNIFVDYLNIMRNFRNPNTENTYMKIKQIAEDLRAIAIKNNWCIISATQTTRDQFDSSDITLQQVSESAGLIATVDSLFGIISDPMMKAQGIYYFKCMLSRVNPAENTRKKYLNDKRYMRIEEDYNSQVEDCIMNRMPSDSGSRPQLHSQSFQPNQSKEKQVDSSDNETEKQSMPVQNSLINITGLGLF